MKAEIALMGNPTCGKTSLFNELTGAGNTVGNWTGVTVTLEIGHFHYQQQAFDIIDLPGIYSLFTHSPEQLTACEYLVNYHPDVIVNVVDSTNLERNLYLTTQLIETGVPVVVALNMNDELRHNGLILDAKKLSELLGVPCVTISATKRIGLDRLLHTVVKQLNNTASRSHRLLDFYSPELRQQIDEVVRQIDRSAVPEHLNLRWVALQMMEEHWQGDVPELLRGFGDQWEERISEERYAFVRRIMPQVLKKMPIIRMHEITRRLDAVLCHRVWALPIFICIMLLIFFISFGPLGSWLNSLFAKFFFGSLPRAASSLLTTLHAGPVISSLILDGVLSGVGGVLVFLPQLMLMFFFLSLLEHSGYMARCAFITDKLLARFGLSGMSFIPLVLGFGCSVPAIMACRTLENKRERLMTMSVVPFMSCSARMPVYALLAAAFFPTHQWLVIGSLYLLGVIVAMLTALLLRPLLMKKERPLFLMEMPPYRQPVWHCVRRTLWMRTWDFISHAGTAVLLASAVIWFLSNFDLSLHQVNDTASGILGWLGSSLTPLIAPLGLGYWQITVALLSGLMSKEAIVASLNVLLGGGVSAGTALAALIDPPAAYAMLVFVLLYTPCVATLAAMRRESKSYLIIVQVSIYQLLVAWTSAFLIYRLLLLFF